MTGPSTAELRVVVCREGYHAHAFPIAQRSTRTLSIIDQFGRSAGSKVESGRGRARGGRTQKMRGRKEGSTEYLDLSEPRITEEPVSRFVFGECAWTLQLSVLVAALAVNKETDKAAYRQLPLADQIRLDTGVTTLDVPTQRG